MESKFILLFTAVMGHLLGTNAFALPDLKQTLNTNGEPLRVFKDHDQDIYWYIPKSIEPWTRTDQWKSSLYKSDSVLSLIFKGQMSVDDEMLANVARSNHISLSKFTPMVIDYSKDFICEDFFTDDPNVTCKVPSKIGNDLELVPISIRIKSDKTIIDEVYDHLKNAGLACTLSVGFKAYSTDYKAHYLVDLNQIYSRFETSAHPEDPFFEADIRRTLQSMQQSGAFDFHLDEDTHISQAVIDQKMEAAFEDLENEIIQLIFISEQKLPKGGLSERGKTFRLRTDYVRSEHNVHYPVNLSSGNVKEIDTPMTIQLKVK